MDSLITGIEDLNSSTITDKMKEHRVPCIVIGAFNKESKYYRVYSTDDSVHLNEHTAFRIASLTKPVFASMFLQWVEQDVFDLDTPIADYYGDTKYIDHPWIDHLTARHILSHQTGFPNWAWDKPLTFEFEPGMKYSYSGEGFVYLQNMLRSHFKQPCYKLLQEMVYNPLNMRNSELYEQLLRTNNHTGPHDQQGNVIEETQRLTNDNVEYTNRMPRFGNAAGTMWSSISDYTTFLHHLMFDPEYTNIKQMMTTPQVALEDAPLQWGLGIGLDQIGGKNVMWHWGSDQGFKSFTLTYLEPPIQGITIFTNSENGKILYKYILEAILPESPTFLKKRRTS